MHATLAALAQALRNNIDLLSTHWLKRCEADPELRCVIAQLSFREFQDNVPAAILHFANSLEHRGAAAREADQAEVAEHGHHRWKQGYSLRELMREWGCLTAVLLEFSDEVLCAIDAPAPHRSKAFSCLAEFNTEAGSASVARYDELKQAEAATLMQELQLMQSTFEQAGRARSELLRDAAHDLRGGLSTIAGASQLIRYRGARQDEVGRVFDMLDGGVRSVRAMLDSLLDLTRLESGEDPAVRTEEDVSPMLRALAEQHRASAELKGLAFEADGPASLVASTDLNKVRRIAQNLLTNAIHHTVTGVVKLQWEEAPDDCWVLRVSDTGPGMDQASAPPVAREMGPLKPSAATVSVSSNTSDAYRGEGIGLLIVKKLCRCLDSSIDMRSDLGVGTTFEVQFPRSPPI